MIGMDVVGGLLLRFFGGVFWVVHDCYDVLDVGGWEKMLVGAGARAVSFWVAV